MQFVFKSSTCRYFSWIKDFPWAYLINLNNKYFTFDLFLSQYRNALRIIINGDKTHNFYASVRKHKWQVFVWELTDLAEKDHINIFADCAP